MPLASYHLSSYAGKGWLGGRVMMCARWAVRTKLLHSRGAPCSREALSECSRARTSARFAILVARGLRDDLGGIPPIMGVDGRRDLGGRQGPHPIDHDLAMPEVECRVQIMG